jgi:Tol biopolymer transport system component
MRIEISGLLLVLPLVSVLGAQTPDGCEIVFVGGELTTPVSTGGIGPSVSANGHRVTYQTLGFPSRAILHDRRARKKLLISSLSDGLPLDGTASSCSLSSDGRCAAFLSSASNAGALGQHVYWKDVASGALEIVTVDPSGAPVMSTGTLPRLGPGCISGNGERVVFVSSSKQLVPGKTTFWADVYVRDRVSGLTTRLLGVGGAEPDKPAVGTPAISADGRYVAFSSRATNLVSGDTNTEDDVFVYDLVAGTTERVSVKAGGAEVNGDSTDPAISAGGRFVAYVSRATNVVPFDTNGVHDVFLHDRLDGSVRRVSVSSAGNQADGGSQIQGPPSLSQRGNYVVFHSIASNLVPGVSGGRVYVRDVAAGTTETVVDPSIVSLENNLHGLSADARTVAFASLMPFGPEDTNGNLDVFARVCRHAPTGVR